MYCVPLGLSIYHLINLHNNPLKEGDTVHFIHVGKPETSEFKKLVRGFVLTGFRPVLLWILNILFPAPGLRWRLYKTRHSSSLNKYLVF